MTFEELLVRLTDLTNQNDHNQSRLEAFKFLLPGNPECESLIEDMQRIIWNHKRFGHMPQNLLEERNAITHRMMQITQTSFTENQYREFRNCF